jgi:anti-sigma B factor antagonist
VFKNSYPVRWEGRLAVVVLPEHVGLANAGQVSEELLSVINRGADVLIADMTATISCDYAGADALLRVRQRAVASGAHLRLAVTDRIVRRALSLSGLDHLVSIYPSLEAAMAATLPALMPAATVGLPDGDDGAAITPAVLRGLLDALDDGVALANGDGVVVLANRRLAEMFGYQQAKLLGQRVDSLIPDLRKDGAPFPAEVRRVPVPTSAGQFTLTVIRDVTGNRPEGQQARRGRGLPGSVITSLSRASLSLQDAMESSRDAAGPRIAEALRHLNDGIREIRDSRLATPRLATALRHAPPDGTRAANDPRAGTGLGPRR